MIGTAPPTELPGAGDVIPDPDCARIGVTVPKLRTINNISANPTRQDKTTLARS